MALQNFSDKEAEINSLKKTIKDMSKTSNLSATYAQTTATSNIRSRNRETNPQYRVNRQTERSKSRAAKNKKRTDSAIASSPPMTFILNTDGNSAEEPKTMLWKTVSKKTKTPQLNLITIRAGKLLVKPQNKELAHILKAISNKKPGTLQDLPKRPRVIIRNLDATFTPDTIARP